MKRFDITKHLEFLQGMSKDGWHLTPSFRNEAIIATDVPINGTNKSLEITLLFSGTRKEISNELLDELLIKADTSYNPSRPFRWYKFVSGCADTDNKESIETFRKESLDYVLQQIDNPETFYIYKILIK